jgi:ElaB/YqjD/DUF883 family membrane-anchored ribosome-binding protein
MWFDDRGKCVWRTPRLAFNIAGEFEELARRRIDRAFSVLQAESQGDEGEAHKMQHEVLNKLGRDLRTLVADADELLKATADAPGEKIDAARARAARSLQGLRDRISAAERDVIDHTRSADRYVHENPWRSIAMTGGIAFLAGLLVGRR